MTSVQFLPVLSPIVLRESNVMLVALIVAIIFSVWHAFAIVYHLVRFGIGTAPKKTAMVFMAGTVLFIVISVIMFTKANWFL